MVKVYGELTAQELGLIAAALCKTKTPRIQELFDKVMQIGIELDKSEFTRLILCEPERVEAVENNRSTA
jgi:hypothetical protein